MTGEDRYYANSDEGEIKRLRADLEAARGQLKHWQHLKEHYHAQARECQAAVDAVRADLTAEAERLTEELAETRAHEHVLVIVGDQLARHLEWMIEEPTSGIDAEVVDAIKSQATPDVAQWLSAITNAGFKRPDSKGA